MDKDSFIEVVARKLEDTGHPYTKGEVDRVIEAVKSSLREVVSTAGVGGSCRLHGLGTFEIRKRGARQGKNPRTGAPIEIGEKQVVVFKMSEGFRREINGEVRKKDAKRTVKVQAAKAHDDVDSDKPKAKKK